MLRWSGRKKRSESVAASWPHPYRLTVGVRWLVRVVAGRPLTNGELVEGRHGFWGMVTSFL